MMKAYWKDIWRSVTNGKKRFLSIAVIAALGVTMMCGLRAACVDLRYSADQFYDEQNLFDIRILSTLGLTKDDVEAVTALSEVEDAEGGYSETVYTQNDGMRKSIEIRTLSEKGFNMPYILEGQLPEKEDEIAITENFKNQTGKTVGDTISLEEDGENLKADTYTITAIIIDAMDVNSSEGAMGFRSTSTTDYVGYVSTDAADNDIYTAVYVSLKGTKDLNCYTDEYEEKVEQVVEKIEAEIKEQREKVRYSEIYDEAMEEWQDGKDEMDEEFAKADKEIADAKQEIADGKKELEDGKEEFAKGKQELANGKQEIEDGWKELKKNKKKVKKGLAQLDKQETKAKKQFAKAEKEIADGYTQLEANEALLQETYEQLTEGQKALDETKAQLTAQQEAVKALYGEEAANQQFAEAWKTVQEKQAEIDAGMKQYQEGKTAVDSAREELEEGETQLAKEKKAAYAKIEAARKELEDAQEEIKKGEQELKDGEQELIEAEKKLADAEQEIADGEKELADGEKELAENIEEYEEERAKAEKELADAKEEIDDIDMTKWYVQDRFSLSGCANIKSDADSIQAIGDVFPILFLTVAILISLTTITRMVEEERGLIGTYKALGFTDSEIRRKYIIYAACACLIGGILGDIGGYVILPQIIFIVFRVMYILPFYTMQFDLLYGMGGILLFEVGILAATMYSCRKALKMTPATLMRPKAPKAGSRVLLERITFIWKRLSFLNKVTARNLFRYKKRLLMTIFGIAGCTALLLCGFTIKNTVSEMMPQQYQNIYCYDMMAVASEDDFDDLEDIMKEDEEIGDYIALRIESIEIHNDQDVKETVQLMVVPEGSMLDSYILLKDKENQKYTLKDGDVFVTQNASKILGFAEGDIVTWQNQDLVEAEAQVTKIVENYLGNMAYMTESTYKELFGEYERNGVLVHFSEKCEDQAAYTDNLARQEGILSAMSTQAMEDEFEPAFALINMVVYVVLVLAALLAFVVLFTLSNTNISERERELATIKVLGFYNPEVHAYVNKETLILTSLGILAGMPMGWALGRYIMSILEFPSLEFYITLYPESYLIAAGITAVFALMVNFITDRTLDKINMIEALKSVE